LIEQRWGIRKIFSIKVCHRPTPLFEFMRRLRTMNGMKRKAQGWPLVRLLGAIDAAARQTGNAQALGNGISPTILRKIAPLLFGDFR
jgi:hypothetical protein